MYSIETFVYFVHLFCLSVIFHKDCKYMFILEKVLIFTSKESIQAI